MRAVPSDPELDSRLQEAFDVMPEGVAVFGPDCRCLMFNAPYARIWERWGVELAVGTAFADLLRQAVAAGRYPELQADVETWIAGRLRLHLEGPFHRIREEFGERLRFETRPTPSGGFVATCAPAEKVVQIQPISGHGFLDTVVENVPAMLFVKHGETGQFLLMNRTAEEMLGITRDRFLGKTDADFFPPDQVKKFAEDDRRVIDSGEVHTIDEEPLDTPHNGRRWLQTRKIAVPFEDDRRHLLIICEDITDRKASAAALADALTKAKAASNAKSEFLANMSHEIRTPLNGVLGMAEVLDLTLRDERQREMMQVILHSGRTLDRLLGDLLDLATIEAGALDLVAEPLDLRETITAACGGFETAAGEKGVAFNLRFADPFDGNAVGDALRIGQVVANLADNAVKFTTTGEVGVEVRSESAPDGRLALKVTVRDTGPGFDPATTGDLLFKRFQQVDGSTTRKFGGTGLGLPIARKLARLMGGDVTCTAEPGEGATFIFEAVLEHTVVAGPKGLQRAFG